MKNQFSCRMRPLLTFLIIALLLPTFSPAADQQKINFTELQFAKLEAESGARLGVCAIDTADNSEIRYRADERFPFCSTFKVILSSAILQQANQKQTLLEKRIPYTRDELVTYSPITEKHTGEGMTIAELCAAALQYSDNTAANLLIKILGGTTEITKFARSIGDEKFRLDRTETDLNTALPNDPRDTTTPSAMASSLQKLTVGDTLTPARRIQLTDWLRGNTTGAKRIRAGLPPDWQVGDKTGSGDYGTANDIAIIWPPGRKPIILAIYTTHKNSDAKWNDALISSSARIVADALLAKPEKDCQ